MGHRATWRACLALAALAAGPARAQSVAFGTTPAAVPAATPPVQVALAPWTAPPALDLFVGEPRPGAPSSASIYRRGDLAEVPLPWTDVVSGSCFTAGPWAGPGIPAAPGDGLADLAWCDPPLHLFTQLSPDEPYGWPFLDTQDGVATGLVFARLLDRPELVLAIGEQREIEIAPSPLGGLFASHDLYYPAPRIADPAPTFALQPLRLGEVARSTGLHDLAWSRVGRPDLFVLWTLAASAQPAVANWDGRLLAFPNASAVLGAGAADADGDGIPDLLALVVPLAGSPRLLALHNPGAPFSLDPAAAFEVGAALGLSAPRRAAPLDLDGVPAVAVFDGTAAPRLHVVTADPGGALRSFSMPTNPAWGEPTQVLAGDVVGSAAADLVAVFADGTIRIWPGDLPPAVAWAPGSPPPKTGTTAPLVLAVDAADQDGQLTSVELRIQGQPSGIAPALSGSRYTFAVPVATLCALGTSATFAVRATDDLGAWREVEAPVAISDAPALLLESAGATLPVPLLPGGTLVSLTAQVADGCGRALDVRWVDSGLPAGVSPSTVFAAGTSVHTIVIPEAAYPGMVAGPGMSVGVEVTASAGGDSAGGQIWLAFDASGLIAAEHVSDRAALAPGELALLTTTLRSRIGVPLPEVALVDRLSGLVPAGPARVGGARILASAEGPEGLSVTLDEIPGGGGPVVVELPVRRAEGPGGSSRAQAVAAATGVALSPAAEASAPAATAAGIACGSGGGSPLWLLGLALYMNAMRRVPARTRSTSSRTPMSRQA